LTFAAARSILKHMLNQRVAGDAAGPAEPDLDRVFQALADPSRRAMLERLTRGPASVSELAAPLTMSLPGVVQHLQVLEAAGLVRTEKTGRVRSCMLEPGALRAAEAWLAGRRTRWEHRLDRLGELLADDAPPAATTLTTTQE